MHLYLKEPLRWWQYRKQSGEKHTRWYDWLFPAITSATSNLL